MEKIYSAHRYAQARYWREIELSQQDINIDHEHRQ